MALALQKKLLEVETLCVSAFYQNCRIIVAQDGVSALIIDPGAEAERILRQVRGRGLLVKEVWLTHAHLDHCGAVAPLLEETGAQLSAHPLEKVLRQRVSDIAAAYGFSPAEYHNCPEPQRYLQGGETVAFGGVEFEVLFTPGHSPGHLCFYSATEELLLCGDTIFAGAIGRTDLPGGNHETLMQSIRQIIKRVPPATTLLSGHGEATTLAAELATNPFLVNLR